MNNSDGGSSSLSEHCLYLMGTHSIQYTVRVSPLKGRPELCTRADDPILDVPEFVWIYSVLALVLAHRFLSVKGVKTNLAERAPARESALHFHEARQTVSSLPVTAVRHSFLYTLPPGIVVDSVDRIPSHQRQPLVLSYLLNLGLLFTP